MPSGYTDKVQKGEVTDFVEFAMTCARAFGACVMLRDEPLSSDIPEQEVDKYYLNRIEELKKELHWLEMATEEEVEAKAEEDYESQLRRREEALREGNESRERYEAMLEKAKAYMPPTQDHENLRRFMIEQLEQSIEWDCNNDYWKEEPVKLTGAQYYRQREKKLIEDIAYCEAKHVEEISRTESRNLWLRQLKESLGLSETKV